MESKHTPTPWKVHEDCPEQIVTVKENILIAEIVSDVREEDITNAAYIVRAVNAYEHALKSLMRYGSHDNSCPCANPTTEEKHQCSCGLWEAQAVAKAEGK